MPEDWILGELPHNSIFNLLDISKVSHSFREELDIAFTTDIDIDFIKKSWKITDYFIAVYEVAGFDRANSKVNIKYFKEINKEMYKQYNPSETIK